MYIPFKFTSLNKYITKERANKYVAAKIKKDETEVARLYLMKYDKIETPCRLRFKWYVNNRRMDADNVSFSKKFVIDGMIKAGLIPNDNLNHITELHDIFIVDKEKIGVEIETY